VNPVTDIYFTQGPMDVLDHSCSKLGFGGKMCIDGTKKQEEEISDPLLPFTLNPAFSTGTILSLFPEITGINEQPAREWDIPVLFISIKKQRPNHVAGLHEQLCMQSGIENIKLICYVEHTVKINDIADILWRFCNNLDPKRDHFYGGAKKNILGLDGTRKSKKLDNFDRPWPNIIVADDETIAGIDKKWGGLGLGEKIISPSLRYKTQLYGGGAAVLERE
jgi:4-hydroxy-3-polyprenylbenzoate decarboxylase